MIALLAALGLPASDAALGFESEAFLAFGVGIVVGMLSVMASMLVWRRKG